MLVHLRFKGLSEHAAEDVLQDFMVEMLDQKLLSIADASKGKFRTLLLTALDRFAISRRRYETAAKRRPDDLQSLDAQEVDPTKAPDADPNAPFERAWALDVLAEALASMQRECEEQSQVDRWVVFERRIVGPLLDDKSPADYAELAGELGLANDKAAMNLLVTAKRQFSRTLRDQVREYVTRATDARPQVADGAVHDVNASASRQFAEHTVQRMIEQEIAELRKVLATSRGPAPLGAAEVAIEDPLKKQFWDRMARPDLSEGAATLDSMFDWGSDLGEEDLPTCFEDLLDTDIRRLLGGSYGVEGAVRAHLSGEAPTGAVLEHLKEWASVQRLSRENKVANRLASAIYFLSIAASLTERGDSLSDLDENSLRTGLEWLGDQQWIGVDQREVAAKAIAKIAEP